jgi:O-antigen ligase
MWLNKNHSLFEHTAAFFIALSISMTLFSNWFGSAITYLFYLLGMASSIALNGSRINFSRLDIPVLIFFFAYLFSIFYAVNPEFKTEILFIPLLFVLYYGGKGIAKNHLTHLLLNYTSILFILFSIYLLYQLSQVNFAYNTYYFNSSASNKIDYLTTAMYAGITFIYTIFALKSNWVRLPLALYSFFIVAISGARFSIFFIASLSIITLILQFRKIVFSKSTLVLLTALLIFSTLFIDQISKKQISTIEDSFSFSIMRISHFNKNDSSLQGRTDAIEKSISAINEHPFFGYGINSSPKVIHYVYPHNMLLEAWLDAGLIAFISLILIVFSSLVISFKLWRQKDLVFLLIINIYIILAHLKSFSILHSILFFTTMGIIFSTSKYIKNKNLLLIDQSNS